MIYRNQTPTMTQIQLLAQMRITTVPEAVAFLRAMRPINDQIAGVLQRASLAQLRTYNQPKPEPEQVEQPKPEPEPQKVFVPEDLVTEEEYSEEDAKEKVSKLKAAKTQQRKEEIAKETKEK